MDFAVVIVRTCFVTVVIVRTCFFLGNALHAACADVGFVLLLEEGCYRIVEKLWRSVL